VGCPDPVFTGKLPDNELAVPIDINHPVETSTQEVFEGFYSRGVLGHIVRGKVTGKSQTAKVLVDKSGSLYHTTPPADIVPTDGRGGSVEVDYGSFHSPEGGADGAGVSVPASDDAGDGASDGPLFRLLRRTRNAAIATAATITTMRIHKMLPDSGLAELCPCEACTCRVRLDWEVFRSASVTVTVIKKVPLLCGIQLNVLAFAVVHPEGRFTYVKEYGSTPPLAVTVNVTALPTVAGFTEAVNEVILRGDTWLGGELTVTVTEDDAVCAFASVTVT
jgi:hypothetical protein